MSPSSSSRSARHTPASALYSSSASWGCPPSPKSCGAQWRTREEDASSVLTTQRIPGARAEGACGADIGASAGLVDQGRSNARPFESGEAKAERRKGISQPNFSRGLPEVTVFEGRPRRDERPRRRNRRGGVRFKFHQIGGGGAPTLSSRDYGNDKGVPDCTLFCLYVRRPGGWSPHMMGAPVSGVTRQRSESLRTPQSPSSAPAHDPTQH